MDAFGIYIPRDRRIAEAEGLRLPERSRGSALFADISGFTPLTAALTQSLGLRRGAEELPRHLNRVYDALIEQVHAFGGSVIGFSGDAITCWFDGDNGCLAVACALRMQGAMGGFADVPMPDGSSVSLAVKVSVSSGPIRRFAVGDPGVQRIDVIAGETVARLAATESRANKGEVVIDERTATGIERVLRVREWRGEGRERVAVADSVDAAQPAPSPHEFPPEADRASLRSWLLPVVFDRLQARQGEFLTELRPATAVFVSFTGIDYDDDEAAGQKLDAFVRWVQAMAGRLEGTLIQLTIGDKGSYLYLNFGAPLSHEDDAVRAAAVALVLQSPPSDLDFIQNIRIGISQGTMRTGAYGGSLRRTYGALGDATNMAARLMGKAAPGQILAAEAIHRATADAFAWRSLPAVVVKGRSEPLPVFELAATRSENRAALSGHEADLPMVGRQEELAVLLDRVEQAKAGRGRIVGVTAEAGMGKSRLIAEALTAAQSGPVSIFGGVCQSYDTTTPYVVWRGIYRALLGVDPTAAPEAQIELASAALWGIDANLLPRLPLLAPVLDLSIPDTDLTRSLDADLHKASRESLLVDLLRARARRPNDDGSALVLVIQDLHWMDPLSHDLLESIARIVHELPVIIVASYRPPPATVADARRLNTLQNFEEIELHGFTAEEAETLIDLKLARIPTASEGGARLPTALRLRLAQRAEGNPFYLDELLNYLLDRGLDLQGAIDPDTVEWPANLHSLILSRIDRLTERQKAMLKVASIIGRIFRVSWLHGYHPSLGDREEVEAELEALRRADLTPLETPEPLAYLFKHVITQEVTYESIAFETRSELHERLAHFVETTLASETEPFLDLLAFHYEQTDNLPKKREYLRRAGDAAQATYANEAAISFYARLLPLLDDVERVDALLKLGQVETLLGRYQQAEADYWQALQLSERVDAHVAAARCRRLTGELFEKQGNFTGALSWLKGAKKACELLGHHEELVQVLLALGGNVQWRLGDYEEAEAHLQEALTLTRDLGDRRATARALHGLGNLDLYRGNYAAARELFEESLATRREIGDKLGVANALNNLGILAANAGDGDGARAMFEESLAIRREIGDRSGVAVALNNLGYMASDRGDVTSARALYEESLIVRRELGDRLGTAVSLNSVAQLSLSPADAAEAERLYKESLAISYEIGSKREAASSLAGLAAAAVLFAGQISSRHDGGDASASPFVRAVRYCVAAEALLASIGAVMDPEILRLHESTLAAARGELGEAVLARVSAEGRSMSFEQVARDVRESGPLAGAPADGR